MIGAFYGRKIGKIFYSLGALGESLFFAIVATYLTYFYIEIARVDPVLVGLGYTLTYGIWNSINDIIAGYISDKTKTRWGRRIFYILFFTPLLMALFILIWTPPISQSSLSAYSIFLYFLLIVFFFEFVYTFVDLSWNSLFPEMYEEIQERSEIAVYRQVFAVFGVIVTFVLAPQLISSLTSSLGIGAGWAFFGFTISVIGGGAFLLSLLGSREKYTGVKGNVIPIKDYFVITFTNKAFLSAAFLIMTTSWMWSLVEALAPFIVKYFLGGEVADITIIGTPMILFPIFSYFLWRKLSLRFGYKVILGATTVMISLVLVALTWTTTILQAVILMSLFGFINGGVQLTRELLIPDVVDDDARRTGVRREGIYYGARTFIDRFALALTGISTAFIFNFSGYISGHDTQPAHVVQLMRLSTTVVFVIALMLFLIAFKYYPFGKKKQ